MTSRAAAADVVRRALDSPAILGTGRLVCVDGPTGSGKTTFAEAVRSVAPSRLSCRVLHMDDVYRGWTGLAEGVAEMATGVVEPLSRGAAGRYRRYDWVTESLAEHVDVPPADLLVVEGVGSGASAYASLISALVWIEAEPETRLARGLARDGQEARELLTKWMAAEEAWLAAEGTRARADLVLRTDTPDQLLT